MRRLAQPKILMTAIVAALATALACHLRLSLWTNRSAPIWYLESMVFLSSIVLWGFVFAWHTPYTGLPVWVFRLKPKIFITATLIGIILAAAFHLFIDPLLRSKVPDEFPADLKHWFAIVLFSLFLNQLFLLFAPFAWLMRLVKNLRAAFVLTVLFSAFVYALKMHSMPISPPLFVVILFGKLITGFFAVIFYLRGGVLLIWWWTLLFEARHLLNFI